MKKSVKKLPGAGVRILSFIPALNCFALVYIGVISANLANILCGCAYFVISVAVPDISPLFWMVSIIHYAVAYKGVKKQMIGTIAQKTPPSCLAPTYKNQSQPPHQFSEITLSGDEEQTQAIPTRSISSTPNVTISYSYETSQSKFFKDMKKYENRIGTVVPFEPFMTYWPTYDSMTKSQQNWYFYWRSEVRKQNYVQTDLSYIFVYIYELLSGVGYLTPQDGYDKLIAIWQAYREQFPKLDGYLHDWIFDFAMLHNLEYTEIVSCDSLRLMPSAKTDLLIDRHSEDIPLKLPFELVDALCDYSLIGSKFYKEDHQALMQEAIPRVVALADAMLQKQKNKGILLRQALFQELGCDILL
ncbi:MAG: TerB N-terminal domain-containing protein [Hydrogenoanaerobacterium sp.]